MRTSSALRCHPACFASLAVLACFGLAPQRAVPELPASCDGHRYEPAQPARYGWGLSVVTVRCLRLRGGLSSLSSSSEPPQMINKKDGSLALAEEAQSSFSSSLDPPPMIYQKDGSLALAEEGHWPSDWSSWDVNPETGLKGDVPPGEILPRFLEEYSSELDELTLGTGEAREQLLARERKQREERGILDPSFKASTLHDDSWDAEHMHLHPDRLVMHKDMPERMVEIMREKPWLLDVADKVDRERQANQSVFAPDELWLEDLESMHATKAREERRKNARYYNGYLDLDDLSLGVDEDIYAHYEDVPVDHPDFMRGPNRRVDETMFENLKTFRVTHDRPYIDKLVAQLEQQHESRWLREPRCASAVALHNARGRDLQQAARCGYVDKLRDLVRSGVSVNFADILRDTPLHWAALNGQTKAVQQLIALRADVNLRTEKGRTPLHHAAAATRLPVVYELIKAGADVHIRDHSNFTALDVALHLQEHDEVLCVEPHEVIRLLKLAGAHRTRLPSPPHTPPPQDNPKFVMPMKDRYAYIRNRTKGKRYDTFTWESLEDDDPGESINLNVNCTGEAWDKTCQGVEESLLEYAAHHPNPDLYRMMRQVDSGRYTEVMGDDLVADSSSEEHIVGEEPRALPPKPVKPAKAQVPIWKKKGPLTQLEREKIDSMGKKAMTMRQRRALNLPRPPPRK